MRGDICEKLFEFWEKFWGREGDRMELPALPESSKAVLSSLSLQAPPSLGSAGGPFISQTTFSSSETQTILLPSPHYANPHFPLFLLPFPFLPSLSTPLPAPTPLNTFLLNLFASAKSSIYIQTPNITCSPVLAALLSALARGVDVFILTSRRLMILEQLITSGTITEFEVWKLRRRYRHLLKTYEKVSRLDSEAGMPRPGRLSVRYFKSRQGTGAGEPVKSHLKLMVVDEEITVLGSGNMDRPSWFTSQELGVAFISQEVAREVMGCVDDELEGREEYVC
jgi:phosphatidylserine/phosphatidylglycerophosphate/cardiolipin synthase-like enzyme